MSNELVERLRGIYRIAITDGLGPAGGEEPDNPNEFVRKFDTPPIQHEAAARIEALEAENARKDAALANILGLIGNVEHKGGGANAARMYADMLNDVRAVARRAREGGNADG